jgi:hypothetical protein
MHEVKVWLESPTAGTFGVGRRGPATAGLMAVWRQIPGPNWC